MDDFGTDLSLDPDLSFDFVSGYDNLLEALMRRLTTPEGSLFYDADYGLDIREWLNEAVTDEVIEELRQAIVEQLESDSRVLTAEVAVKQQESRYLLIGAIVETTNGPFELVLAADQVKVEVLHGRAA